MNYQGYQGCCQAGAAKGLALCLIHNGFSVNTVTVCPGLPKIGPVYDRCLDININCAHFTLKSIPGFTINNMGTLSVRVCLIKSAAYPQQSWINTMNTQGSPPRLSSYSPPGAPKNQTAPALEQSRALSGFPTKRSHRQCGLHQPLGSGPLGGHSQPLVPSLTYG